MKTELPPMHLFDKGKSTAEEPVVVSLEEEGEDEAEAAASAVAVAAISNDEVAVGTVVASSVSAEQKNICSADAPGSTSGQDSFDSGFFMDDDDVVMYNHVLAD
jgi:tetrahydromethanopterin S-methyltransferase subunit A